MFRRIALVATACFAFASAPSPAAAMPPTEGASTAEDQRGSRAILRNGPQAWNSHVDQERACYKARRSLSVVPEAHRNYPGPFHANGYRDAVYKLHDAAAGRLVVSIFGSANTSPGHPFAANRHLYDLMKRGCAALAKPDSERPVEPFSRGALILHGGGPGFMKAGHEGASSYSPDATFAAVMDMGSKQQNGSFDRRRSHTFTEINARKAILLLGDAFVVGNPGDGTLDEVYQAKTAIRIGQMPPKPLVLVDQPAGEVGRPWHSQLHLMALDSISRGALEGTGLDMWTVATSERQIARQVFDFYHHYAGTYLHDGQRIVLTHRHLRNKLKPRNLSDLRENVVLRLYSATARIADEAERKLQLPESRSRVLRAMLTEEQATITDVLDRASLIEPPQGGGPMLVFPEPSAKVSYLYPIIHELNALDL